MDARTKLMVKNPTHFAGRRSAGTVAKSSGKTALWFFLGAGLTYMIVKG